MKKQHVILKAADLEKIEDLLSKSSLSKKMYKRATALRCLHLGKTYKDVSKLLDTTHQTISNWAQKYKTSGLSFLEDKARSGRPREIDASQRAKITALASSTPPKGYQKWSLRLLANKVVELGYCEHISHNQVGLILKKTNLGLT